jgi:6-phosphogluconolactonase (cycloisomerase 2 family)
LSLKEHIKFLGGKFSVPLFNRVLSNRLTAQLKKLWSIFSSVVPSVCDDGAFGVTRNLNLEVIDRVELAKSLFILKHSIDVDTHKHAHTLTYVNTHAHPIFLWTPSKDRVGSVDLEIDKITTGVSLSTGTSSLCLGRLDYEN